MLKIALAQINTTVGDLKGNAAKITAWLDRARKKQCDLVVFPELTLTGYPPEDLLFNPHFVQDNLRILRLLAAKTKTIGAIIGFVDRDASGRLFNAAAFLDHGRLVEVYRKTKLPNYGVFDEKRYFQVGARAVVVQKKGVRIALSICEDVWRKDSLFYKKSFRSSCDLLINLSASPFHAEKQPLRYRVLRHLAAETRSTVIYCNLVGGQDELVFDGGSLALDPRGRILAQARQFEEDLVLVNLPAKKSAHTGKARYLSKEEEVYKALVLGTRDYVHKNGFEKVVIGLSGGIDSALVARIAVDALGASNVVGVTMPSCYTSSGTYEDAYRLAQNLGIPCLEFKIDAVLGAYLKLLKNAFGSKSPDTTEENLQARIRGNLLMALSNKFAYLALTTGNKSEMATGYCTLYGDMAGGFAVIKDVPKTLVYRLARYRNRKTPKNSIPVSIFHRPPTAELRHNQRDQDTLPPYPQLDRILALYIEKDTPVKTIVRKGLPRKMVRWVTRAVDRNEYKRRQAPPGIKITPKAFGRDRRMPITNRYTA